MSHAPSCYARTGADDALLRRFALDRDAASREALFERYLPLARSLCRRYRRHAEFEDLQQVASIGLLKAIERFDPAHGRAFSSFAVPTIVGELKRYFRDLGWMVRVPRDVQELSQQLNTVAEELIGELGRSPTPAELAKRAGVSREETLEALASASAHHPESLNRPALEDGDDMLNVIGAHEDAGFERVEDAAVVEDLLATLPTRERRILKLRFQTELTQAEIGTRLGLSQMQISRLLRRALTSMQEEHTAPTSDGYRRAADRGHTAAGR